MNRNADKFFYSLCACTIAALCIFCAAKWTSAGFGNSGGMTIGTATTTASALTSGTLDDARLSTTAASAVTAANAATSANTASTIVKRDSSGNFSAGTVTATAAVISDITGTANTAVTLYSSPPAAAAADQAGPYLRIAAADAVAGTTTGVGAAGGDVQIYTGAKIHSGADGKVICTVDGGGAGAAHIVANGSELTSLDSGHLTNGTGYVPLACLDHGTGTNQVFTFSANATLPALNGAALTNIDSGHLANATGYVPVACLDWGTNSGQLVRLGTGGTLPAVSGANLTNLPATGTTVYCGQAQLNGVTAVTVTCSHVAANSVILIQHHTGSDSISNAGNLNVGAISAGNSFNIVSDNALDTAYVDWMLVVVPYNP